MTSRQSLLVGSIPAANTDEAVAFALDDLGSELIAIPDGTLLAELIDGSGNVLESYVPH